MKTIGDALMLRIPGPGDAILLGLDVSQRSLRDHGSVPVRVGLHHGPAVELNGDYFGAAVNLAARVSSAAGGGEVFVSVVHRPSSSDLEGVVYESRGRRGCGT